MASQRISTYMKNVAKSFGYALGDTMGQYNPTVKEIAKQSKDAATSMYAGIKSFKYQVTSKDENTLRSQAKDTINDVWNNIKDDLKTGNWYNKERKDALSNDAMKAMGFDFDDFDFDFDEDWGDEESISKDAAVEASAQVQSAKQIIDAVDDVGYKLSSSMTNATVESASYIVAENSRSSKALYNLNSRGFSQISSALMTINTTINNFAKLGEPLTAHMQNSAVFYTNATQSLKNIEQTLVAIEKNTKPAQLATDIRSSGSRRATFSNIFSGEGIDIDSYKSMVKDAFGENKELVTMALDAVKGMKGSGSSAGKNISVMQFVTTMMTKVMIPKVFKESMQNFNVSLENALYGLAIKFRDDSSGGLLLSMLKDIILPQDGFKTKVNTAKYHKGAVAWDGISRKALTEVIPISLMKIYSAITGKPEARYDYNTGKFVNIREISNNVDKERKRYAESAGGEFRTDILKNIDNSPQYSAEKKAQLTKEVEDYFYKAFMTGGTKFAQVNKSNFKYSDYGLTPESLAIIREVIESNRNDKDITKRNRHTKFLSEVQRQRDRYGDMIRNQETSGTSLYNYLNDGSEKMGLVDEFNHNPNFYLQGIYQYTGFLADNIDIIGGRGGKVKRRKGIKRGGKVDDIKYSSTNKGEKTKETASSTSSTTFNPFGEDELDEDQIKEQERKERSEELSKRYKGFVGKIRAAFDKENPNSIFGLYERPFNAAAKLLDRIGLSMEKLIWGEDDDPEKGIMGFIFKKYDDFKKWLTEEFKIREKWDSAKGKVKDFFNPVGENLKKAGKWVGNTVSDVFLGKNRKKKPTVDQAAYGRRVTKSGIVAVSEGELIIPSELNPFYHGYTNKRQQTRNEQNAVRNFYGTFADGGTVGGNDGLLFKLLGLLGQGLNNAKNGTVDFISEITGKKDNVERDKSIISKVTSNIFKEMGENKGAMGAGALIGAGVSVLTGSVVGPVFGAAIGSAAGLVVNSKKVQHILFGADPETGEVNGGLLSKNVSQFIMKHVPGMAKGATVGGVAGLFMGSPILGALVGSAVGYVSSSQKAKEYIFGKVDENGREIERGLISKELQDKIKKAAPNMAVGALAGMAVGPFGLMGNLVLGAGLGYLTTSEKFHDYMFSTDEDNKGLVHLLKEKVFDNLDEIFHNMGNALSAWGKNLMHSTSERIKDFFTKKARAYQNGEDQSLFGRMVGGALSIPGRALKGATNVAGNFLGNINTRIRNRNLAKGYNVYDRTKRRNMVAGERNSLRSDFDNGSAANFDRFLAGATKEEIEASRNELMDARDPNRIFRRATNSAMRDLYASLSTLDPKRAEKIAKMVQKGDPKSLDRILRILDPSEVDQYIGPIDKALSAMAAAKNTKKASADIVRKYKDKGIDISKSGDIGNYLDLMDNELKSDRFSPEKLAEQKEEDWRERITKIFSSIDINIAKLVPGGGKTAEAGEQKEAIEENSNKAADVVNGSVIKNEETEEMSVGDMAGNLHHYRKNNQGEWEKRKNDSTTDEASSKMDKFMESINHIPLIGSAIGGMKSLFGKLHDGLLGSKDGEKKGLLSKILGFFDGSEDGVMSWLFSLLAGQKIGKIVKGALSHITLKGVATNVLAPGLLLGGFSGLFDSAVHNMTDGAYGKGGDSNITETDSSGKVSVRDGDVSSFSERLKYNTGRGILTGTSSVASKILGKTTIGRSVASVGSSAFRVASSVGDDVALTAAKNGLCDIILDNCAKFTKAIRNIPVLNGLADSIDNAVVTIADKATDALASKTAKSIASFASNAVVVAKIAFIVADFTTGYEDARNTLGILSEPTVPQKIISGLLRAIKNCIPVIGTLIPDSLVVDVFCEHIAPFFGIEPSKLMAQREEAEQILTEYNNANGTNYTHSQYVKTVLGDYTWTERIGNAAKSTWADTKSKFSNMKSGIKEKGLGGYLGDSIKGMASNFASSYKESGGGLAGIFSGIGTTFNSLLPGVIGEISQKNMEIKSLAVQGKLKELWSISLKDFSQGETGEDGIEKAVPSMFSKIIGQIPLITSKISATPFALVSMVGNKVIDVIGGIVDKVKNGLNFIKQQQDYGTQLINDPDSNLSDFFKIEDDDPENPIGGLSKAIIIGSRLTSIPMAIVRKIGKGISNTVSPFIDKIKNTVNTLQTNDSEMDQYILEGNISGLINHKIQESEDNPVFGFVKAINFASKITKFIPTTISWVGHKVGDWFTEKVETTKANYETLNSSIEALKQLSKDGNIGDIWNYKLNLKQGDMLGGIFDITFNISKFFNTIGGLFNKIINPVKEVFDDISEGVGGLVDKAKNWGSEKISQVGSWANDKYQDFKSWISGEGSGFVSQLDPKYKDMRFGDSTVGEKGCAPAVASMIANKYGKNLSMDDAISASRSYQNKNGTSADYFKSVLGSRGIGTSYLTGNNIPGQIMQNLANGQQVIILGKDASNTSKDNSPFGPNSHYVVATGIDKNGNIIVNDPESNKPRVYNQSILKNSRIGISTTASGSGSNSYDSSVAQKVWGFFTSKGFTPAATAGIMGNIWQESKFNPAIIQGNGKGPAAGLFQWENYNTQSGRWKAMADYAASKGYDWKELTPQLEYALQEINSADLNNRFGRTHTITDTDGKVYNVGSVDGTSGFMKMTDPMAAVEKFEAAFERAGKPNFAARKKAAEAYYKLYHNSSYTGNYEPSSPGSYVSSTDGSTGTSTTSSTSGLNILSAIGTAFSNAFGKVFGGSEDTSTSATSTGTSIDDSSNVTLGPVPTGNGNSLQKKIVQYANSILGKNQYTQEAGLRTRVGSGYSDCSAFAQWVYKNALGIDPGGYTGAQIQSPLLTTVDSGTTPDKSKLEMGDLLFFRSKSNNGRYKNVGHVEIYDGNGNVIGHGSGKGPTVKNLDQYAASRAKSGAHYIEARRYTDIASAAGGSSGLLMKARPGSRLYGTSNGEMRVPTKRTARRFSGGASSIGTATANMLNDIRVDAIAQREAGKVSSDLVEELLKAIVKLLESIANNTSPTERIYQALLSYIETGKVRDVAIASASNNKSSEEEIDSNIRSLVGTLAAIAKG